MSRGERRSDRSRLWRPALLLLRACVALAALTAVCLKLQVDLATAALLYLVTVVLLSIGSSFQVAAAVALLAGGCLDYFFTEPLPFHHEPAT